MKRIALLIGLIAGGIATLARLIAPTGWDLSWALAGARALVAGGNPYTAPMPMDLPLFYPPPTLLAVLPIVWLPDTIASVIFSAVSAGVLAYAVVRYQPCAWPMLLSAPFWIAVLWSQWSLLITAAVLIPALLPLAMCKPNLGLPVLLVRLPRRSSVLICAGVLLVCFALQPTWLFDWLTNALNSHDSAIPLLTIPGVLLVLAIPRWRDPRARLLLGMACMPQRFYDPLALWTIPQTARGGLLLSALSWLVCGAGALAAFVTPLAQPPLWLVVLALYIPALVYVIANPMRSAVGAALPFESGTTTSSVN